MSDTIELAPLEELENLIPKVPSGVQRKQLGDALVHASRAATGVFPMISQIKQLVNMLPLVQNQLDEVASKRLESHRANLAEIAYQADAATTAETLEILARRLGDIPKVVKELQLELKQCWTSRVELEFAPAERLGEVLRRIPDTGPIGNLLYQTGKKGQAQRNQLPTSSEGRDLFEQVILERDAFYGQLKELGTDSDVIQFLEAVAIQEANLTHVTPNVMKWINDKGAATQFNVTL